MNYSERKVLPNFYKARTEIEHMLILTCLFSIALIIFRMVYTGTITYLSMVWNLFLAFIPYAITQWLIGYPHKKNRALFFAACFIWLLFIPNSFYILTDLFHLDQHKNMPLWYDLALLFSCAWNGLMFGILSVRQMEIVFQRFYAPKFDLLFLYPVMLLNALGVYLGRFLRFNSWDIFTNPFYLIRDIIYLFIHPLHYRVDWSMIICYSVLMTLIYVTIKKLGRSL